MALSNNPTPNELVKEVKTIEYTLAEKGGVYRGTFNDWSSVPSTVNEYEQDGNGNKTPLENDYIIINSGNGKLDDSSFLYQPNITGGGASIGNTYQGITQTYIYTQVTGQANAKTLNNLVSVYYDSGPGQWVISTIVDCSIGGVNYTAGDVVARWGYSSYHEQYLVYEQNTNGGILVYKGSWSTDGKNGWDAIASIIDMTSGIYTKLSTKQDSLVSGTNIKTINNESILGSGNITVSADTSDKMDKANPTGTGALSVNRKSGTTIGTNSVAIGNNGEASGNYSVALGYAPKATTNYACAIHSSTASEYYTLAAGNGAIANGANACAFNRGTKASGQNSSSFGDNTTAQRKSQHTFGEYNVLDTTGTYSTRGTYVEIVGNGTVSSRSNARTLDWSGNEWLAGNLQAAGLTDGTTTKTMTQILAGGGGSATDVKVDGTSITSNNEADLITINGNYNASTNKLATASDIPTIPTNVSSFTNDAGYLTQHQDISGKEDTSNKVTSISSLSTDTQYPSAKLLYDKITDVTEIAEGKTANYVISDATTGTNVVNTSFNSTQDTVAITVSGNKITDVQGNNINLSDLKVGDIVSITETAVPDRWVGSIASGTITFYKLETKLDIDSSPTSASSNPVSSGGVYTALGNKMDNSNPTGTGSFSLNRASNTTIGLQSVSAGLGNEASGAYSCALNGNTKASALYSLADGYFTQADGSASHASGLNTVARGPYQYVFGKNNRADYTSLEIVGNGADTDNRSNARTLDANGNEWLAGKITPTGGISDGNNANYELQIPNTTNWTADKTIATTDQIPANITITTTSGSESVSDGTNTLSFGTNAFNSTTIPTTYVSTVNGSSGAVTGLLTSSDLLTYVYPVGSVYLSIEDTSPASFLGGTWTKLSANYALWTASSGAGSTISAGLPNITGFAGYGASQSYGTGAFYKPNSTNEAQLRFGTTGTNKEGYHFDASRSNNIYGSSSTVQPPAYKVYAWRRTS